MNPLHGIVGDNDGGIDLPQTQVDPRELEQEKNMAKFSKSKEFKRLEEFIHARVQFYQKYLPDGKSIAGNTDKPDVNDWIIANTVIAEFEGLLGAYGNAREAVENVQR